MIHAASCKAFNWPPHTGVSKYLFASGALVLALDPNPPDGIHFCRLFGDFTAGFSHWVGVGAGCLIMQKALNVRWSSLGPIPTGHQPTFDYSTKANNGQQVELEFRGRTRDPSMSEAVRGIASKKRGASAAGSVRIGTVVKIGTPQSRRSYVRVVDPEPAAAGTSGGKALSHAARLLHYGRIFWLAGLRAASYEMVVAADHTLHAGREIWPHRLPRERDSLNWDWTGKNYLGQKYGLVSLLGHSKRDRAPCIYHGVSADCLGSVVRRVWPDDQVRDASVTNDADSQDKTGCVSSFPDGSLLLLK